MGNDSRQMCFGILSQKSKSDHSPRHLTPRTSSDQDLPAIKE